MAGTLAKVRAVAVVADGVERVAVTRVAGDMEPSLDAHGADPCPPLHGSAVQGSRVLSKRRRFRAHLVLETVRRFEDAVIALERSSSDSLL